MFQKGMVALLAGLLFAVGLACVASLVGQESYEEFLDQQTVKELPYWTRAAAQKYPRRTLELAGIYGAHLDRAIERGGLKVVPVVYHMHHEGSTYFDALSVATSAAGSASAGAEAVRKSWKSTPSMSESSSVMEKFSWLANTTKEVVFKAKEATTREWQAGESITPIGRGWVTIEGICSARGGSFLDGFEMTPEGELERLEVKTFTNSLEWLFADGLINLQSKRVRGEEVTPLEYGSAGLEALVALGATVKVVGSLGRGLAKSSKAMKATKVASKTSKLAKGAKIVGKTAKAVAKSRAAWAVLSVTAAGLAISHPKVFNGLLSKVAEHTGVPTWLVMPLGWLTLLAFPCILLSFVWMPLLWFSMKVVTYCSQAYCAHKKRRGDGPSE